MKLSVSYAEPFPLFDRRVKESSSYFYSHPVQEQKLSSTFTTCSNLLDIVLSSCVFICFLPSFPGGQARREGRPQHNSELAYICPWWPRDLSGWFPSHLPPGVILPSLMCWDPLNCFFLVWGAGCTTLLKSQGNISSLWEVQLKPQHFLLVDLVRLALS